MMKSIFRITFVLWMAILLSQPGFSQITDKSLTKSNEMDNTKNKETIQFDKKENPNAIYFIDKFSVPKTSIDEFIKQMNYNRAFIKTLAGYKSGQAFEQYDHDGVLTIITIAVWENQDKVNEAKTAVQNEFKRIGFNPQEFYQRLNIKMERGQYTILKE